MKRHPKPDIPFCNCYVPLFATLKMPLKPWRGTQNQIYRFATATWHFLPPLKCHSSHEEAPKSHIYRFATATCHFLPPWKCHSSHKKAPKSSKRYRFETATWCFCQAWKSHLSHEKAPKSQIYRFETATWQFFLARLEKTTWHFLPALKPLQSLETVKTSKLHK